MERRVTSIVAPGRTESGRGPQSLGPDSGNASGRTAVTKADEGVAPSVRGATQIVTHGSPSGAVDVPELTHDEIRGQLSDYLDATLSESERRRVESHLATCQPCSRNRDSLRATVKGLGQLPAPKAPAGAGARILEQARRERETQAQAQPQPQQPHTVADE